MEFFLDRSFLDVFKGLDESIAASHRSISKRGLRASNAGYDISESDISLKYQLYIDVSVIGQRQSPLDRNEKLHIFSSGHSVAHDTSKVQQDSSVR